jgi:SAM-dependent methyltransferase
MKERFTGKAEIYKKFRPAYPKELLDYLYSQVGFINDSIIADIGSGTGIFSRLLLERGNLVYCVEPNEDMRKTAEKDNAVYANFISINAPAENTELQENSVDFVTAAQAFHWFDKQLFKQECRRILRPGGKVVLVWNIRDLESDIIKNEYIIRKKYSKDNKGFGVCGGPPDDYSDFFADRICEVRTFRNDLRFDRENFIGRNLSASYIAGEEQDPENYHGFVSELNELFDKYNINGILNFPHYTQSYIGEV